MTTTFSHHVVRACFAVIVGLCVSSSIMAMPGDYDHHYDNSDSDAGGYVSTSSKKITHSSSYQSGSWKIPSGNQVIKAVIRFGTVVAVIYVFAQFIAITMINAENITGVYQQPQQYVVQETCPHGNRSLGIMDGKLIRDIIDYISCTQIGLPSEAKRLVKLLTPEQNNHFMELLDLRRVTLPESVTNNPFVQYYLNKGYDFIGSHSVAKGSTEAPFFLLQSVDIDPNGNDAQAALAYCKELIAKFA